MTLEQTYTSTGDKILRYPDRLSKWQSTGIPSPITTHIMPTSRCNLNCVMCSVKDRPKEDLDKQLALDYLQSMHFYICKGVIFSGGGDPLVYQYLEDLLVAADNLSMKIGLITNGILLDRYHTLLNSLSNLSWIRVSGNTWDYRDDVVIPKFRSDITVGFSYVFSERGSEESVHKVAEVCKSINGSYIRLLPDCTLSNSQFLEASATLGVWERHLRWEGYPAFLQDKFPMQAHSCYLGYFHPVLYTDGYVYPCDSLVLNNPKDKRFHHQYRMCHASELSNLYQQHNTASIVDTLHMCPKCVFTKQNNILSNVVTSITHEEFI